MDAVQLPPIDHGLNQATDPSNIPDNQAVDILNYEYDIAGVNLQARPGLESTGIVGGTGDRISSLYGGYFNLDYSSTEDSQMMVTYGTQMLGQDADNGVFLGVAGFTGGASISPNAYGWQWASMNKLAVAVNGTVTPYDNPIRWNGQNFAFATQLGGSAPQGQFIAVWNGRMWILKDNRLYWSALGDCEDWTAVGVDGSGYVDIGYMDGEYQIGIYVHQETLWISSRSKLRRIVTMVPNTDPGGWRIEDINLGVGFIYASSVLPFGDFLVGMTRRGLMAISSQFTYDDFKTALISKQLKFDFNWNLGFTGFPWLNLPAVVRPDKEQYLVFVPGTGESDNYNCYVLDRHPISGNWRFVRWRFKTTLYGQQNITSDMPISAATVGWYGGKPRIYLGQGNVTIADGAYVGNHSWVYTLSDTAFDDEAAENLLTHRYDLELISKKYSMGNAFSDKEFDRVGARFGILNVDAPSKCDMEIGYRLDESQVNPKDYGRVSFMHDQNVNSDPTMWRRLSDSVQGRQGKTIQLRIRKEKTQDNVGILLKDIALRYRTLNNFKSTRSS